MSAPRTRDFEAFEDRMPPKRGELYVVGQVETHNGSLRPVLRPNNSPSINPTILLLDLTIEKTDDPATKDIAFRDARYDHDGEDPGYETVIILFEGDEVESLKVQVVH